MWMRNAVVRLRGLDFRPVAVSQAAAGWLSRSERGWLAAAAVALRLGRQAASVARSLAHEKSSALC